MRRSTIISMISIGGSPSHWSILHEISCEALVPLEHIAPRVLRAVLPDARGMEIINGAWRAYCLCNVGWDPYNFCLCFRGISVGRVGLPPA